MLCKQGVAGSNPVTSSNILLPFKHLLIRPLFDFRKLGPFGSNKKLLHFFVRSALLFRNRVQINLPCVTSGDAWPRRGCTVPNGAPTASSNVAWQGVPRYCRQAEFLARRSQLALQKVSSESGRPE